MDNEPCRERRKDYHSDGTKTLGPGCPAEEEPPDDDDRPAGDPSQDAPDLGVGDDEEHSFSRTISAAAMTPGHSRSGFGEVIMCGPVFP